MKVTGHPQPDEENVRESVEKTFATSLAQLDKAHALGLKLIQLTSSFVTTRRRSEKSGAVVVGLYWKALKTVRAIRLVASADLQEDGLVLCRTLLETTVAILYVLERNAPHRADEFFASMIMRTIWTMEDWQKTHGLKVQGRRIHRMYLEQKRTYERRLGATRLDQLRKSYSGKSIKKTFEGLRLSKLYQTAYARLSTHQHATDLSSHVEFPEDGGIQLRSGGDAEQMRFLLDLARLFFCAVMQRTSEEMELGYLADIEALKPRAKDLEQVRLRHWKQRMLARRASP